MDRRRKILMATTNYWNSPFQVGSHQIAKAFARKGWNIAFISDPISVAHALGGVSRELTERFNNYRNGGSFDMDGKVWTYVSCAILTPHNKPLLRSEWLLRNWHSFTLPDITKKVINAGFGNVDLLYFDSIVQSFWLKELTFCKSVLRVADNNAGFSKFNTPSMKKLETELARKVDAVVYSAANLESLVLSMDPKRAFYLPNGVNYEHFADAKTARPVEYDNILGPIAVYVGAIDVWFDFSLVMYAAKELPDVTFVLIGPESLAREKIRDASNIRLLGRKDYSVLPSFLQHADVGIIPFDVDGHPDLVHSVNPLKLYEYMACGLPVVSVEWKELTNLKPPAILTVTPEGFVRGIKEALTMKGRKDTFKAYAASHDWSKAVEFLAAGILS